MLPPLKHLLLPLRAFAQAPHLQAACDVADQLSSQEQACLVALHSSE
jgi:hypothetical protein